MSDGEWCTMPKKRTVKSGSVLKADRVPVDKSLPVGSSADFSLERDSILKSISECKASLLNSSYFSFVRASITGQFKADCLYDSIVALGIGRISSGTSQLQLALFICLCESLTASKSPNTCSVFDPIITELDIIVYRELGIPVLGDNSKGKHTATERTLFFLPHCPYRLYCNVLWANWNNMDNAHIFGNSFQSYGLRRAHLNRPSKAINNQSSDIKSSNKKGKKSAAADEPLVDPADTVATLTPFMNEIDLWPLQSKFTETIDGNMHAVTSSSSSSPKPCSAVYAPNVVVAASKTQFLKEAQGVPALRHLENAVCDMSFMYLNAALVPNEIMLLRPSEALIDEAALNDVELF